MVSSDEAGVGLYSRGARRSSCRCRGRMCTRMSSLVDDGGGAVECLTGQRRPTERKEEGDGDEPSQTPLCARGHAAACVGEEAPGGGAGSR